MLNVSKIKRDFPILKRKINGKALVYLDNAATTQKPKAVINALVDYYTCHNANIHRGIHTLSEEATSLYEEARKKIANFLGARWENEIIFTRNSTEAINLVAYSWGRKNIGGGDEIIISEAEHHSNLVPWQILAKEKKAILRFVPIDREGCLDLDKFKKMLNKRTKFVSLFHMSNVLGTINPVSEISKMISKFSTKLLIDGSQSAPRMPIDVKLLGCDFFVLTGHKMLGPTGIGVLWGKEEVLDSMPPFLGGGDMIRDVTYKNFATNDLPYKFEAGTPNIAGAIGLGKAVDYLQKLGMEKIFLHEQKLTKYALEKLSSIREITIYGPLDERKKVGIIAFNIKGIHPHDLAQVLDGEGIAIRSGHHCAMPLHTEKFHIPASARISFYIYNDTKDIDKLVLAIYKAKKIFRV